MTPELVVRIRGDNATKPVFDQVVKDAGNAKKGVAGLTGQTGNLAAQFQDIAVQLQSGTSPFVIALQQGTQISAVLGPMGARGAVSALGSAFMSLLSPVSLITVGAIAAGGAMVQWFGSLLDKGPAAQDQLKAHKEWLDKILVGYEAAAAAAAKTAGEAKKLPQGVVASDLRKSLSEQASAVEDFARRMKSAQDRANSIASTMQLGAGISRSVGQPDLGTEAIIASLHNMEQLSATTTMTSHQIGEMMTTVRELFNTTDNPAIKELASDFFDLAGEIRESKAWTEQQEAALKRLQSIGSINIDLSIQSDTKAALDGLDKIKALAPDLRTDYQKVQDELNAALLKNSNLPDTLRGTLDKGLREAAAQTTAALAKQEADQKAQKLANESASTASRQAQQYQTVIESLQLQTQELGMNSREQEKANQVKAAGVATNSAEADAIRAQVDQLYNAKDAMNSVSEAQKAAKETALEWASVANSFVGSVLGGLREGKSLWQSFAEAGVSALDAVSQKLIATGITNLFTSLLGGGNYVGGTPGAPPLQLGYQIGVPLHHTGGIAGETLAGRTVSADLFAHAQRYHSGGVAGLAPDEVPAILQRGERVLRKGESGGLTINLTVNGANMQPDELARVIDQRAAMSVRRAQRHPHRG